jgi:hypothetical protein
VRRNRRVVTNKAPWAAPGHSSDPPWAHITTPHNDKCAASPAVITTTRRPGRGRGSGGVSLGPTYNSTLAPAGLGRSVRTQWAGASAGATGGAHRPLAAAAEDEGDLEAQPVRPRRDRKVEPRDLSRPRQVSSAHHRAAPVLRCCCATARVAEDSRVPIRATMSSGALRPPGRSRTIVRGQRRHDGDAHGRRTGGQRRSQRERVAAAWGVKIAVRFRRRASGGVG